MALGEEDAVTEAVEVEVCELPTVTEEVEVRVEEGLEVEDAVRDEEGVPVPVEELEAVPVEEEEGVPVEEGELVPVSVEEGEGVPEEVAEAVIDCGVMLLEAVVEGDGVHVEVGVGNV